MSNVIDMTTRNKWKIDQHNDAQTTPDGTLDEHACTRQARILHAWLLDSMDDPSVGADWTIAKLRTAIELAEVRRVFKKL